MKDSFLYSSEPADQWARGYPVGNGKTGAMMLGGTAQERIALNYGLLWRKFMSYQKRYMAEDFPTVRKLCLEEKWEEAHKVILNKIPFTSDMLYVSPYVPVGDMYIQLDLDGDVTEYKRTLNMSAGEARTQYRAGRVGYTQEVRCLYDPDVLVVRLRSDIPAKLRGRILLSRMPDPTCWMEGFSKDDRGIISGHFEEDVNFAAAYRIIARGGRLTDFSDHYTVSSTEPEARVTGNTFVLRDESRDYTKDGIHTAFDCMDEIFIVIGMAVDEECVDGRNIESLAMEKVNHLVNGCCLFEEYAKVFEHQEQKHRKYFERVSLQLEEDDIPDNVRIQRCRETMEIHPADCKKLFDMGRYLAIASGYPMENNAPINLQGIWNQDLYPAWDCDLHLDLNVQMAYWPLAMAGLSEFYEPLLRWALKLMPKARIAAKDLYGCRGLFFSTQNDFHDVGCVDNMMYCWTGAAAWLAQTLYTPYEYTGDVDYLRRLYPFLKETAEFYEDFLSEVNGELHPVPSASMEAGIKGRKPWSVLSSPSAMDMELIHWLLTHAAETAEILGKDQRQSRLWRSMEKRVPWPVIGEDGKLKEWLGDDEIEDPGHRHRSGLLGVSPIGRITPDKTPEEYRAAEKSVHHRQESVGDPYCTFECVLDTQFAARFRDKESARKNLKNLISYFCLENYMLGCIVWTRKNNPPFLQRPLFQIDSNISIVAGIIECVVNDYAGYLQFLPALPSDWKNGRLQGVALKGGDTVNVSWTDGQPKSAELKVSRGKTIRFLMPEKAVSVFDASGERCSLTKEEGNIFSFTARPEIYRFVFEK